MARPARPWFRFYVEAIHDRKLRRLKPEYRWLFVVCLAAARQSPEPGVLLVGADDPMDWDDLVDWAAMPLRQVERGMDDLQERGLVVFADGRWSIPKWDSRQYESDSSVERVRKHRSMQQGCNGETSLPVTPPETETDTDTEAEREREAKLSLMPQKFHLTDADIEFFATKRPDLDVDATVQKFVSYQKSRGTKSADWHAELRVWAMRERAAEGSRW